MKKVTIILLMVCILFSVAGCSALTNTPFIKPTATVFSIDNYHLQITADSTFQEKTGGSFDLQLTNGSSYISIMAYKYIDLPENVTPLDVYNMQNEDLFSKRINVTVIEDVKTQSHSQRTVTQALYSAEKDNIKNYYASYLVDLPDNETFAWVLISATPSYLKNNREYLQNIVYSLTPIN